MDKTVEVEIQKIKPVNNKTRWLLIISLISIIFLLAGSLILITIKEKRELAKITALATQSKIQAVQSLSDFHMNPNSGSVKILSQEKGMLAFNNADEQYNNRAFEAAATEYNSAVKYFQEANKTLKKYNELISQLSELESGLPAFETLGSNFPDLSESSIQNIVKLCAQTKEQLNKMDLEQALPSIGAIKTAILELDEKLKSQYEALEKQWAETLMNKKKESYQIFISTYPHSKYCETAKAEIAKIINAEEEKKAAEELVKKQQEEELKKEQAIIAARKEKQAQELKQKMQLEQVVTVNFDDGSSYTGQLNMEKKPHGDGTFSYTNSNVYRGQWKNGLFHGEGSYEFYTGESFKGEWSEGKRHGKGIVSWKNGDSLTGMWSNGLLQGKAIYVSKTKFRTTLNFHEGENIGRLDPENYERQKVLKQERYEKKRLTSNENKAFEFMKRYKEALRVLKTENPDIIFPDFPVVIPKQDSFAAGRLLPRDADKHIGILKNLYFEQKKYLMVTKKSLNKDEIGDTESAEFGGYTIMTANLGVILDNSGSMTSYLPKLRKKIEEKFKKSAFIEVTGCSLIETGNTEITLESAKNSTIAAIKYLVTEKGADTIYWFSDLNDNQTEKALEELRDFFYKNLTTFYISSVGYKPSKELKDIIEESGGKVLRF